MYHTFVIHLSVDGLLESFQLLNNVNRAAMIMVEQGSLQKGETSFEYMPRSGIVGS